jgi:hypothetical protein
VLIAGPPGPVTIDNRPLILVAARKLYSPTEPFFDKSWRRVRSKTCETVWGAGVAVNSGRLDERYGSWLRENAGVLRRRRNGVLKRPVCFPSRASHGLPTPADAEAQKSRKASSSCASNARVTSAFLATMCRQRMIWERFWNRILAFFDP